MILCRATATTAGSTRVHMWREKVAQSKSDTPDVCLPIVITETKGGNYALTPPVLSP